ncbi:MAG: hypothetical protein A3H64_00560 [Candidatus Ryanbacteria bacterium RIFCSPLOWO2_02_FULL_45_11c]|uniref:DUF2090 domain-containing protein n=1 Tax=Candidatus Ryanbacteria bacterium RIFCSPLOWO2_02_FULL_45_11c TaxID=1802128 RepID=A0A1G2GWF5_9BACT|nr:MAG: hypothetical protein A3H64_00560 [Candidatus Ryanbacteria bacterium RIFCSPLOWO2_02_FULL_45_11c]
MRNKLYILPFDHRGSFIKMFGFDTSHLDNAAVGVLSDYKHIIYEGFLAALEQGAPSHAAAILVDEQFGARIQNEAKERGVTRILTVEKSGQDEFDFEYGADFGSHIDMFSPDYIKALVRYNPESNVETNRKQIEKLLILNAFCHEKNYKFLFELLVPATSEQLASCNGSEELYEKTMRGGLMKRAMEELRMGGVEPDVWKLEGLESSEDMRSVAQVAQINGREHVGIVVLGRGESDAKVRAWLGAAARVDGVIGFAVGRTVFKEPLLRYHKKQATRDQTARAIADNYKQYVDLFEAAAGDI